MTIRSKTATSDGDKAMTKTSKRDRAKEIKTVYLDIDDCIHDTEQMAFEENLRILERTSKDKVIDHLRSQCYDELGREYTLGFIGCIKYVVNNPKEVSTLLSTLDKDLKDIYEAE